MASLFSNPGQMFDQNRNRLGYKDRLAQTLLAQGAQSGPIQHPMEVVARLGQALAGTYLAKKAEDERKSKADFERLGNQMTMQQAMRAATGFKDPDTGEMRVPGSREGMMQALSQNPNFAHIPVQSQLQQYQAKDQAETAARLANEKKYGQTRQVRRGTDLITEAYGPKGWETYATSDPGLKSPEAQAQATARRKASAPVTNIGINTGAGAKEAGKQGLPPGQRPFKPGEIVTDKKFADFYNTFAVKGGKADVLKGMSQLSNVVDLLNSGKNVSGALLGILPNSIKALINPAAVDTEELISEVVQRNLKPILGGAFGEKEGRDLIKRAYNPSLDEATNAERVGRLLNSVKLAVEARVAAVEYWEEHKTLRGFKGKSITLQDIERSIDGNDAPAGLSGSDKEAADPGMSGITIKRIR